MLASEETREGVMGFSRVCEFLKKRFVMRPIAVFRSSQLEDEAMKADHLIEEKVCRIREELFISTIYFLKVYLSVVNYFTGL